MKHLITCAILINVVSIVQAGSLTYVPKSSTEEILTVAEPGPYEVRTEKSRFIRMRDGVRLSTDLTFPVGVSGKLPVILRRTPYDKAKMDDGIFAWFASHGYVVAQQDLRGKYESEGEFFAYDKVNAQDGYDTLSWLTTQSWSNGRVGTYGCSYEGEVQHMLTALRHPAHKAAIITGDAAYKDDNITALGFKYGGATEIAATLGWNIEEGKHYLAPPPGIDREAFFQSSWSQFYEIRYKPPEYSVKSLLLQLPTLGIMDGLNAPPNHYREWLLQPPGAAYWNRQGGFTKTDRFSTPTLLISSWYDFTYSPRAAFNIYRNNATTAEAREHTYLILGPGSHCQIEDGLTRDTVVGERHLGDARYDFLRLYLDWFAHWLRDEDTAATRQAKVQLYVMGENRWRAEQEWPLVRAQPISLYLSSGGRANSSHGDGRLQHDSVAGEQATDSFIYDPVHPTPTRGAAICCTGDLNETEGAVDVADIELRHDTLVYTTAAFEAPMEIIGEVSVELYVSSDAPDTDIVARLTEVDTAGRSWVLLDGIQRLRWRQGMKQPVFMKPGEVAKVSFDIEATGVRIPAGHKLRLDIASAGYPRWDRNLNTGGDNVSETQWRIARNMIHHSAQHRSRVILPVVPVRH
jgi:uncharacterized protein